MVYDLKPSLMAAGGGVCDVCTLAFAHMCSSFNFGTEWYDFYLGQHLDDPVYVVSGVLSHRFAGLFSQPCPTERESHLVQDYPVYRIYC